MAFVYWIRASHHTDMFSEGYIGFTSRSVQDRFEDHKIDASTPSRCKYPVRNAIRKYADKIVVETIVEGDTEYCLHIEEKLRPDCNIGWNIAKGGGKPPSNKGKQRSAEARLKASETMQEFYQNESEEARASRLEKQREVGKTLVGRKWGECQRARAEDRLRTAAHPMFAYLGVSTKDEVSKLSQEVIAEAKKLWAEHCGSGSRGSHTEETKKRMSEISKVRMSLPWNVPSCNKDVWVIADAIYEYYVENPTFKAFKLARKFNLAGSQTGALLKKFQSGWVPVNDPSWVKFKDDYEQTK